MKGLVIGGGLTGLSAAYKLSHEGHEVLLLERGKSLGGISSSFIYKDCELDYGPHKIYTQMPHIMDFVSNDLKLDLIKIKKKSKIRLMGKYYNYPIGLKDMLTKMNPIVGVKAGTLAFLSLFKFKKRDDNFKNYLTDRFGSGLFNIVFKPYAEKVWGDTQYLSSDLARVRVPMKNVLDILGNMVGKKKADVSADFFYYPHHGIKCLSSGLYRESKQYNIFYGCPPSEINVENNKVVSVIHGPNTICFNNLDYVISTMRIDELPPLIKPAAPKEVLTACTKLRYKSLILLYLVINKDRVLDDNWIFFPEKEFTFNRISEQKGFNPKMVPKGKTVLTVEMTCDANGIFFTLPDTDIFDHVVLELEKAKILEKKDVIEFFTKRTEKVYPIYDLDYKKNLQIILDYLDSIDNLITVGRGGLFNYNNMDHCIDMGFVAANHIINKTDWKEDRKKFEAYSIVD